MATVAVTPLRTQQQKADVFLSVFKLATLMSATVTGSPARGARSISYTSGSGSGFAAVAEGQTVVFDTPYGLQRTFVKSVSGTVSSGTLELYENPLLLTNGDTFDIYHFYEPHPVPPAIRGGIFYKFYDLSYSDQNSQPNPVVVMGSHRAGRLSSGSIVFDLDASDSYAVAQGASISSYQWSCVHNGGGTSGITIASASSATTTITITEEDQFWLSCRVTDSNGKTATSYRAIFTDVPYIDFTIQSFSGDWDQGGYRTAIRVTGDAELDDFPDRSLVVLWHKNLFDNAEGYVNLWGISDEVLLCGYIRQDTDNNDYHRGTGNITFQITTIDDLINNVSELGSVSLNAVSSPAAWWQYASWMTAGRSVQHLLLWQAWGLFQCCDVIGLTDNTLGVLNTDYSESSLLQQVNGFTEQRGIFARLISDNLGRLHLVEDSNMLNDAGRAALDTVFTITTADVSGPVDVVRAPEEQLTFVQLDGFSFDGSTSTPYVSIFPGYRESGISYIMPAERGGSVANISNQVLADQTDSDEKVGRYAAVQNNNPRELRFANPRNYLGAFSIIPSVGWHVWGISDANLKRNAELYNKKFLCRHIEANFVYRDDRFTGIIQTSVALEREAIGPPGIQGNYPLGYPAPRLPEPEWNQDAAQIMWTVGSEVEFEGTYISSGISQIDIAVINSTTGFIACKDSGILAGQGKINYQLLTITAGVPAVSKQTRDGVNNDVLGELAAIASISKAVSGYVDDGSPDELEAVVIEENGSIALNTPLVANTFAGAAEEVALAAVSDDRIFYIFKGSSSRVHLLGLGVDLVTLSDLDDIDADSGGAVYTSHDLTALDSTRAVLFFRAPSTGYPSIQVFENSSDTINRGTASTLASDAVTSFQNHERIVTVDSTRVLAAYLKTTDSGLYVCAAEIGSGTTIDSVGSEVQIDTLGASAIYALAKFDTDKVACVYRDASGNTRIANLNLSGTTITLDTDPPQIITATSLSDHTIASFSSNLLILAYEKASDGKGYMVPLSR